MEIAKYRKYLVVIGLMAATSVAIALMGDVRLAEGHDIRVPLPDRVGVYQGQDMVYCQNRPCMRGYEVAALGGTNACPACGGTLDPVSVAERQSLPEGTEILRKNYVDPAGRRMLVSVAITGRDRLGIHRPQNCLYGQGFTIGRRLFRDLPGVKPPTALCFIDLERTTVRGRHLFGFACAYVGAGRRTAYHSGMMYWMAYDRLVRNSAERWAYISIMTERAEDNDEHLDRITAFAALLFPELLNPPR